MSYSQHPVMPGYGMGGHVGVGMPYHHTGYYGGGYHDWHHHGYPYHHPYPYHHGYPYSHHHGWYGHPY